MVIFLLVLLLVLSSTEHSTLQVVTATEQTGADYPPHRDLGLFWRLPPHKPHTRSDISVGPRILKLPNRTSLFWEGSLSATLHHTALACNASRRTPAAQG